MEENDQGAMRATLQLAARIEYLGIQVRRISKVIAGLREKERLNRSWLNEVRFGNLEMAKSSSVYVSIGGIYIKQKSNRVESLVMQNQMELQKKIHTLSEEMAEHESELQALQTVGDEHF
mmetsp:Transcript_20744/g.34263  ORF Transcript_20744/g.34263 Transcript_20744/m.34263 type:complete len:120 (-) Transcript_20744:1272-1631(-)